MKKILVIGIILLFIASSISISNEAGEGRIKNERIIAKITYKSNESIAPTLQPIVVITQPEDGAVVTDPHLVVLGYASDEIGMNYWEWEWHYKGGSYSNSSYFETAQYVEFRIDIYGLHPGWNLIIVRFKNIYGAMGEDSVNVTYKSPNHPPNKPSKPQGPTKGKVKTTLYFNTVTTDPDGDSLEYLIDWGDGTNTGWIGPIASGYPFESFHAWDEPGIYEVKAKARDIPYYAESEWSDPLIVTISPEDTEPPVVVKKYPPNGATFTEPNITAWGYITDNVGVVSFGYTQEWEGGGTGSSWPLEEPATNYSFEIPLTLHEGWNRIKVYATDEAGNVGYDEETVTYVVEDTIPPTTTKIVGEPQYDEGFYVTSETSFTLVVEDNEGGSGVAYTKYRIWYNGSWSEWVTYSGSFILEGEGIHYVEFYSVDKAGNVEEVHNNTHFVDDTPPSTYIGNDKNDSDNAKNKIQPEIFALIVCSSNRDKGEKMNGFIVQALYTYWMLRMKGVPKEHIVFVLWHHEYEKAKINEWVKDLFKNKPLVERKEKTKEGKEIVKAKIENKLLPGKMPGKINDMWCSVDSLTHEIIKKINKKAVAESVLKEAVKRLKKAMKDVEEDKKIKVFVDLIGHGSKEDIGYGKFWTLYCFDEIKDKEYRGYKINPDEADDILNEIRHPKKGYENIELIVLLSFCHSQGFGGYLDLKHQKHAVFWESDTDHKALLVGNKNDKEKRSWYPFSTAFINKLFSGENYTQAFRYAKKVLKNWEKILGRKHQKPNGYSSKDFDRSSTFFKKDPVSSRYRFNLYSDDNLLPENRIFYRIDKGNWINYSGPFSLSEEGWHTLEYYGVDPLGNREDVVSIDVYIDDTPPGTVDLVYPVDKSNVPNVFSFDWSDVEDVSSVYYMLQVATDESFNNIVLERRDIVGSEYIMNKSEALFMGTYYWRVKAIDGVNNSGEWSEVWSFTVTRENSAPDKPSTPIGPTTGKINVSYTYSSNTTDADGDRLQYIFDWGDGTFTWTDWHDSGETVNASHIWYEKGTYQVKVKAIDIHGYESEWSDPLPVIMPYSFNIKIEKPKQGYLYIFGNKIVPLRYIIIIGSIKIGVNGNGVNKVEFYIDEKLKYVAYEPSFMWLWNEFALGWHEIKVIAYDYAGNTAIDEQKVWIFNI